jgi:Copper type II ascorbate-dependent monooxygenase, C-terminal domain
VTDCQTPETTRVVGFFPHMHMLGTSMTLEVGPSADSVQSIYSRDPYDFNDQTIDGTDMVLEGGQHARLTCNYNNTRSEAVTYGESSLNEMCFLIMFVVGPPSGCIRGSAPLVGGAPMGPSGGDAGTTAGCPNVGIMGTAIPGCCTPEGMCGIDTSQFTSNGCVELGAAAAGAAQMGYTLDFPAPRACGADAGTP